MIIFWSIGQTAWQIFDFGNNTAAASGSGPVVGGAGQVGPIWVHGRGTGRCGLR